MHKNIGKYLEHKPLGTILIALIFLVVYSFNRIKVKFPKLLISHSHELEAEDILYTLYLQYAESLNIQEKL